MKPAEVKAVLQAAFNGCEVANCPLTDSQKQILLQMVAELMRGLELDSSTLESDTVNPLDELTTEQRSRFLDFVKEQEQQNRPWKIQLLNDWLHERDSGQVQFVRDRYGPQWLNRIKPIHFAQYANDGEEALKLKIGDHIEISNSLWEWVQETGPCSREWFTCTVISVNETGEDNYTSTNCIIRFINGAEYEIQGVYQWNRYNWRWPGE